MVIREMWSWARTRSQPQRPCLHLQTAMPRATTLPLLLRILWLAGASSPFRVISTFADGPGSSPPHETPPWFTAAGSRRRTEPPRASHRFRRAATSPLPQLEPPLISACGLPVGCLRWLDLAATSGCRLSESPASRPGRSRLPLPVSRPCLASLQVAAFGHRLYGLNPGTNTAAHH